MKSEVLQKYNLISSGNTGFIEQRRGLIEVSGKEAIQFLNGLITNDVAKLEENAQMSAAFPNAQGRLLAVVRVMRAGDRFLFETAAETHEKVFQNLFRFTFAGDFFVADLSEKYIFFSITNKELRIPDSIEFQGGLGKDVFVPNEAAEDFLRELKNQNAVDISGELYEVLRIERGIPLYGVDIDETTIVPELGIDGLISYNKGCYIGQEIIARIHFRGHIAKQLTGLILSEPAAGALNGQELKSADGRNAGKITSVTFSPKLEKTIALAFVRYDYLAEGTELKVNDLTATVKNLPFSG
jgi:folate-binding protein YgfZ